MKGGNGVLVLYAFAVIALLFAVGGFLVGAALVAIPTLIWDSREDGVGEMILTAFTCFAVAIPSFGAAAAAFVEVYGDVFFHFKGGLIGVALVILNFGGFVAGIWWARHSTTTARH